MSQEVNRLKLVWWRTVVEDIYKYKKPAQNTPVALELAAAVKNHSLNKGTVSTIRFNAIHLR